MSGIADHYDRRKAMHNMTQQRVVLFAAGTGNPFFTTDSAACLRGIEIDADIVLKATKVDGIYSADPMLDPRAKRYHHVTYRQVLEQDLKVMDLTAICLCRDHHMPVRVFNINKPHALRSIVLGGQEGTLVTGEILEK
jgi:uridylate kinase